MILFDIFRWFAIIQGFWLYWLFFKRKTYYEDGNTRHKARRFKGPKLIISNHKSVLDFMLNMYVVLHTNKLSCFQYAQKARLCR